MPYKREGKRILHQKGGKWVTKQICKSIAAAKAALRLLYGIEAGWRPTGKKRKK